MFFEKRRHNIAKFATPEELVARFRRCATWTLCSGFRWSSILLLNDSTGEDGIQEYAVIKLTPVDTIPLSGTQIESLTVEWMSDDEMIVALERYEAEGSGIRLAAYRENSHPEGPCRACA